MGNEQHNVNDNVKTNVRENNVNDNVRESYVRRIVIKNISEDKLKAIQDFLFKSWTYDSTKDLLNPAIKQVEKFVFTWYTEVPEPDRKAIVSMMLETDGSGESRPYKDYTESPLWKYTSSVIKAMRGFTCSHCRKVGVPAHLVVHHKSYQHLGSELAYPEDMEVLCNQCHLKEHGIRRTK
jgi:hypothetical protein